MLQIASFTFNPFQENTYLVWDQTSDCAIIDPGCFNHEEEKELENFIESRKLNPVLLLNTHCHIDHVLGNTFVTNRFGVPLHLHERELQTYRETDRWTSMVGLPNLTIPENLTFLKPGENIKLGESLFEILFTPGHSIASVSFYNRESDLLLAGDVLFRESIGRTDLPSGNFEILESSIRNQLYSLPDQTKVYPGHGPATTIQHEIRHNPFVNGK